jgi:hypothetical protein
VEAHSHEYEKIWGTIQQNFIQSLITSDYITFRPEEKPEYKNRIVSFFYAMGGNGVRVNILRIKGVPEKDYCFFNNLLYSVSEDWGNISLNNADAIIKKIKKDYIVKNIDNKEDTTIITFEKDRNKKYYIKNLLIMMYKLRIFYYTNDLFNILLKRIIFYKRFSFPLDSFFILKHIWLHNDLRQKNQ